MTASATFDFTFSLLQMFTSVLLHCYNVWCWCWVSAFSCSPWMLISAAQSSPSSPAAFISWEKSPTGIFCLLTFRTLPDSPSLQLEVPTWGPPSTNLGEAATPEVLPVTSLPACVLHFGWGDWQRHIIPGSQPNSPISFSTSSLSYQSYITIYVVMQAQPNSLLSNQQKLPGFLGSYVW